MVFNVHEVQQHTVVVQAAAAVPAQRVLSRGALLSSNRCGVPTCCESYYICVRWMHCSMMQHWYMVLLLETFLSQCGPAFITGSLPNARRVLKLLFEAACATTMQDVQDITLGVKREAELTIDASLAPQKRLKRNLTQEQDSKVWKNVEQPISASNQLIVAH
jgi:hypothetical protein